MKENIKSTNTLNWNKKYKLAKAYFEHYGDLEVPRKFKTKNGYKYNENGINLGEWVSKMRVAFKGKGNYKLTQERICKLNEIGMSWDRYIDRWEENYDLLKTYYEHHGNLEIPRNFKTTNGYEYDENGVLLGELIYKLRGIYRGKKVKGYTLTEEKIAMLNKLDMRWEYLEKRHIKRNTESKSITKTPTADALFNEKYELAKIYFNHYGNLLIPQSFITTNGYDYDENGIRLGRWVMNLRNSYRNVKKPYKLTKERISKLDEIGMVWTKIPKKQYRGTTKNDYKWIRNYNLLKAYFEHYGNSYVPRRFKTLNGYDYDENGIRLGEWVTNQCSAYIGKGTLNLTKERIKLLEDIEFAFNVADSKWMMMYNLATVYYKYHKNLAIPRDFKTSNGYEYDEGGLYLGNWINDMRQKNTNLDTKKIKLLNKIGMIWESYDEKWMNMYNLSKEYFKNHGDLRIPYDFKTSNGYEYDENGIELGYWINVQRSAYKAKRTSTLDIEKIRLLDKIGMIWFNSYTNEKLQNELITEKNRLIKSKEVLNRFYSSIGEFDSKTLPNRDKINAEFTKKLEIKR